MPDPAYVASKRSVGARVLLFLAGLVVMAGALVGILVALLTMLTAASPPNALEGTVFCCASPSAWSEVPANVGIAMAVVAVDATLWVVASWLFAGKVRRRQLLKPVAGSVVIGLLVVVASLAATADDAVVAPSCDRYDFDRAAFRSSDASSRRSESLGLARCDVLQGRSRKQVRALLGKPDDDRSGLSKDDASWQYGRLTVSFDGGRVTFVEMASDPGFEMS